MSIYEYIGTVLIYSLTRKRENEYMRTVPIYSFKKRKMEWEKKVGNQVICYIQCLQL